MSRRLRFRTAQGRCERRLRLSTPTNQSGLGAIMDVSDTNGNGTLCTDIDECTANLDDCSPLVTCTNTTGSYTCGACPQGYDDVNNDGKTDIIAVNSAGATWSRAPPRTHPSCVRVPCCAAWCRTTCWRRRR